jgi:chromosome segregation ATPase
MNQVGNQPPYGAPQKDDSKKNLLTIAGIAIALLLGTNIFLWMSKSKTSDKLEQTAVELDNKESLLKDLQAQFDKANADLDAKAAENSNLQGVVDQQKAELAAQKDRITKLAGDSGKLASAREELGRMRAQVDGYLEKIKN